MSHKSGIVIVPVNAVFELNTILASQGTGPLVVTKSFNDAV